ncbi:MAG: hypothetical protein NVSMB4_07360 [Acidimicrobiales bacterium]
MQRQKSVRFTLSEPRRTHHQRRGFLLPGGNHLAAPAVLAPSGADTLVTATEAAGILGVACSTITNWVARGHLAPSGLDHRGRKLYRLLDLGRAERATRERAAQAVRL